MKSLVAVVSFAAVVLLASACDNSGFDRSPSWSPDGSHIAFRSTRDGDFEIYIMNADGSGQTRLTNDPEFDGDPAWSPVP